MLKEIVIILNFIVFIWMFILLLSILFSSEKALDKIPNLRAAVLLLVLFSGLFALSTFFALFFSNDVKIAGFFLRLTWGMGAFCVASYFYTTMVFINSKNSKVWIILQFVIATIIGISAFTPVGITSIYSIFPSVRDSGFMDVFFRIWIIGTILYSLYLSSKYYIKTEEDFRYYMLSIISYVIIAGIGGGLLPLLQIRTGSYFVAVGAVIWISFLLFSSKMQFLLNVKQMYYKILFYSLILGFAVFLNHLIVSFLTKFVHLPYFCSCNISLVALIVVLFATPLFTKIEKTFYRILFNKKIQYQQLIKDTAKYITEILDVNRLLNYVLENINRAFGVSKIAIFLLDENNKDSNGQPVYKFAVGYGLEGVKSLDFKNYKIIQWLEKNKEPFMVDLAMHTLEKEKFKEFTEGLQIFGAVIVIPIIYNEKLVGILTMDNKKAGGKNFDIDDIETIQSLADQLAVAIQNSCLYKELDMSYLQIIRALSLTLESKESYLLGHTDDVVKYAAILARSIGLSQKEIFVITQAAILHDLGKIAIHDYILNKPEKLTEKEWEEVKQHPIKGAKILEPLPFLKEVAEIVKNHHERYDGTGYPDGKAGDEIPLGARILSIADAVDSMLSERPYRRKLLIKEVIEELERNKGKQFDPVLVDKFLEIVKENPLIFSGAS